MNLTLRACPSPAFALPLPCLCRQAGGRHGGRQGVFLQRSNQRTADFEAINLLLLSKIIDYLPYLPKC